MSRYIEYIITPVAGQDICFRIDLDAPATSDQYMKQSMPVWTHLQYEQCSHCPLSAQQFACCPLAVRVREFVDQLGHFSSVDKMTVQVLQGERAKQMIAPAQDIMGSLLGLLIATSDCPHTYFLRPMAYFHSPLSDPDETIYRVLSMYRLAQYLKQKAAEPVDPDFAQLQIHYENMVEVNHQVSKRIRRALSDQGELQDGAINAMILLDSLSQSVAIAIDEAVDQLRPVFQVYLSD